MLSKYVHMFLRRGLLSQFSSRFLLKDYALISNVFSHLSKRLSVWFLRFFKASGCLDFGCVKRVACGGERVACAGVGEPVTHVESWGMEGCIRREIW